MSIHRVEKPACAPLKLVMGMMLLVLPLAGCGEASGPKGETDVRGQTIARVNGQEITEHELEAELKGLGTVPPDEQSAKARDVLRRMIQRTVLAQQAEEMDLHRTPEVMAELRRKRAQVLARAYVTDALARQMPISKYDVADFIEQHPHYFSDRKHYVFDQLLIPEDLATEDVMSAIKDAKSLEEVEQTLSRMNVDFRRRLNSNLGNQFPREAVIKMDALKPGELFLTETRDYAVISKIVDSRLQPISGEDAHEIAERLLLARRDATVTHKLIDNLLATSRIDLLGEFSDMKLIEGGTPEIDNAAMTADEDRQDPGGQAVE